jgi:hypothetical protein
MGQDIRDIIRDNVLSDCCGAIVYLDDVCSECKEHCSPICTICEEDDCDGYKYHKHKIYRHKIKNI